MSKPVRPSKDSRPVEGPRVEQKDLFAGLKEAAAAKKQEREGLVPAERPRL